MTILWGIAEDIGLRESLEDAYVVMDHTSEGFFSAEIFDGHGGKAAANYAAEMMTPAFRLAMARELEKPEPGRRKDPELVFRAYDEVNRYIVGKTASGTTAATLYFLSDRFLAANAGDSRIIIGTAAGVRDLSEDHKPYLPAERSRIESLGGRVLFRGVPRVQGILSVSRSLGDVHLKPFVAAEPRVVEGLLGNENDYAVLACDGVWDVLTSAHVMALVREAGTANEAARRVMNTSLDSGSTDNITVIVLDLRPFTATLHRAAMEVLSITDFAFT